jgi:hypothetical protein
MADNSECRGSTMIFERELKTLRIMRRMPSAVSASSVVSEECGGAWESGFCEKLL